MNIPILADLTHQIGQDYGVYSEESGCTLRCDKASATSSLDSKTHSGTFIVDPKGILRHSSINDFPVGRSVDEVLRLVQVRHDDRLASTWLNLFSQAFQFVDSHNGEVCPGTMQPHPLMCHV